MVQINVTSGMFVLCVAAEEVVKRAHTVSKTLLTVVPYKPPGPPTKVKVSGLTSKASEELLQLYFEKVGDCDVKEVQMDANKGEAMVTFADPAGRQYCFSSGVSLVLLIASLIYLPTILHLYI